MAIAITEELTKHASFNKTEKILAYFFCDSSSENHRTATSMLRGLIYQLLKECPSLMRHVLPKFRERRACLTTSFDALWTILIEFGQDTSREVYCIIDALDECESDSQQTVLDQINDSFAIPRPYGIHFLITSRPYPEIREQLLHFTHQNLASYTAVKEDLKAMIRGKVKILSERKNYPMKVAERVSHILDEKAEGTFLWVGIVCAELLKVQSRNAVQMLQNLPVGLHALYRSLLSTALGASCEDQKTVLEMLKLVAFTRRPLSVAELCAVCDLYPNDDDDSRLQFTTDLIDMCRLMIVLQDNHVRLLHKSVKDFLVQERDEIDDLNAHSDLANRCIGHILKQNHSTPAIAFLKYADVYWPEHASLAKHQFNVGPQNECFFGIGSSRWLEWLKRYESPIPQAYRLLSLPDGFRPLHAAAYWEIVPLATWALRKLEESQAPRTRHEWSYDDAEFIRPDGVTPLREGARQGNPAVMKVLLQKMKDGSTVSEGVLKDAAANENSGKGVIALLLDKEGAQTQITEDVLCVASENWLWGKDILQMLLGRRGDLLQTVIEIAARKFDPHYMTRILQSEGVDISITKEVVVAAFKNRRSGKAILKILLGRQGCYITDDVEVTNLIARHFDAGTMALLLDMTPIQILCIEEVLEAAAGNWNHGHEVMQVLLERQKGPVSITDRLVKVAVRNQALRNEIMTVILKQTTEHISITADAVNSSVKWSSENSIALFLSAQNDQLQITERMVLSAVKNSQHGAGILELLLNKYGDQIPVTEEVLRTAAAHFINGKSIIKLLLDRRDHIPITERVIMAATGNWVHGYDIMKLFLCRHKGGFLVGEDITKTVLANWKHGKKIMKLLLRPEGIQLIPSPALVASLVFKIASSPTVIRGVPQSFNNTFGRTYMHELTVENGRSRVIAGSFRALVERLVIEQEIHDSTFTSTFFLTFRLFATPQQFIQTLIDLFDHASDIQNLTGPGRLQVYSTCTSWLMHHWRHDSDFLALESILSFARTRMTNDLQVAGENLIELAQNVSTLHGPIVSTSSLSPPDVATSLPPVIPSKDLGLNQPQNDQASVSILEFDPLEFARQLTIKGSRIFSTIRPEELLATEWMKKNNSLAVHVRELSVMSTELAHLVAHTILQLEEPTQRAAILTQWVHIADKCLELRNYDALMAITCSLNSSMILRLKRTWALVAPDIVNVLKKMRSIVDVSSNYTSLRVQVQKCPLPCLPFVGIYLTDLTFIDHRSSNLYADGTGLINFEKQMETAKIIRDFQEFQQPYQFIEVSEIQEWIEDGFSFVCSQGERSLQRFYRRSLFLEPRDQTHCQISPCVPA
jgi:hypothetical protein